jgi:hypothetical protein
MSDSNTFDFYDSDNIRKNIIKKLDEEKKLEEILKCDLVELKNWFEVECKVIEEKQKILKKCYDDLRIQKSYKEKVLRDSYGANNVQKVKRKYNIGL